MLAAGKCRARSTCGEEVFFFFLRILGGWDKQQGKEEKILTSDPALPRPQGQECRWCPRAPPDRAPSTARAEGWPPPTSCGGSIRSGDLMRPLQVGGPQGLLWHWTLATHRVHVRDTQGSHRCAHTYTHIALTRGRHIHMHREHARDGHMLTHVCTPRAHAGFTSAWGDSLHHGYMCQHVHVCVRRGREAALRWCLSLNQERPRGAGMARVFIPSKQLGLHGKLHFPLALSSPVLFLSGPLAAFLSTWTSLSSFDATRLSWQV